MSHDLIAQELAAAKEQIVLVYAFNGTGKTRLSVAYKNATKDGDGNHAGVYYNAYSEDLFVWDNDPENAEVDIQLDIRKSSLNRFHSSLSEDDIREKLNRYVLKQIGIDDADEVATIVNTMSHKKVYYFESDELVPDTREIFEKVYVGLKEKYQFVLHTPAPIATPPAATEPAPAAGVTP